MADLGELSPELRLLAACVAWPPSQARTEAIRAAADGHPDWPGVLKAVRRHRVAGFVNHGLTAAAVAVPADFRAVIDRLAHEDVRHGLRFAAEAVRLTGRLRQAGIPVQVLKGPGLMMLAYGQLGIRQSRDLDLLTPVNEISRAVALCIAAGYVQVDPPPTISQTVMAQWLRWRKDIVLRSPSTGAVLELHFRPVRDEVLSRRLDLQSQETEVAVGPGLTVPAPTGEALYAYLCVHGALAGWFRLKWLGDIAALTAGLSDERIGALHAGAVSRGAGRASGQALLLVEAIFHRALPADLRRGLVADAAVRRLARLAFRVIADPEVPTEYAFRSAQISLSHLLIIDSWRYRLYEVLSWLIDWRLVFALNLPRRLWFLYPLLRGPAWAVHKISSLVRGWGRATSS